MGSIGVLLAAFKDGFLTREETRMAMEKIRSANRHISDQLLKDALDIVDANDERVSGDEARL